MGKEWKYEEGREMEAGKEEKRMIDMKKIKEEGKRKLVQKAHVCILKSCKGTDLADFGFNLMRHPL